MKICFVAHEFGRFPGCGGIATCLLNLYQLIKENREQLRDHHFTFAFVSGPNAEALKALSIKGLFSFFQLPNDIPAPKIRAIVSDYIHAQKFDVVEVADYSGLAYDFLLNRSSSPGSTTKVIVNHHTGTREIVEWCTDAEFSKAASASDDFNHNIEMVQNALADGHIAPSQFLARFMRQRLKLNVEVVPNAQAPTTLKPSQTVAWNLAPFREKLLYFSRLERRKGVHELILACLRLIDLGRDLHLTCIGNSSTDNLIQSDYRLYCISLIPNSKRHHFSFFDYLPLAEVVNSTPHFDLAIIPSRYENFPGAAIEIINSGLPVMGSISSGIADLTVGAEKFLLFDASDPSGLQNQIGRFLDTNLDERNIYAGKQRENVGRVCDPANSLFKRLEVYSRAKINSSPRTTLTYDFSSGELCLADRTPVKILPTGQYDIVLASNEHDQEQWCARLRQFSGAHLLGPLIFVGTQQRTSTLAMFRSRQMVNSFALLGVSLSEDTPLASPTAFVESWISRAWGIVAQPLKVQRREYVPLSRRDRGSAQFYQQLEAEFALRFQESI